MIFQPLVVIYMEHQGFNIIDMSFKQDLLGLKNITVCNGEAKCINK